MNTKMALQRVSFGIWTQINFVYILILTIRSQSYSREITEILGIFSRARDVVSYEALSTAL